MKFLKWTLFAALSLLLTACEKEDAAKLEIDAPAEITFKADGTGGMEAITVTTNQPEWSYTASPADGAGWLTIVKEGNLLKLTAAPNTEITAPESVKITFTAGNAPEKVTMVKQLAAGAPTEFTYSVDDLWPDSENPAGIVFWIDPASSQDGGTTGTAGWVMSLKQSPSLAWCENRMESDFGTNSDIDGRLNMDAVWAYDAANPDFTGTFHIFEWCRENYGDQWYIPSLQEMRRFLAVYAGLTPEQTTAYMNGRKQNNMDNILGSPGTWAGTEEHRKAYDMRLIDAGGDGLWDWDPNGGSAGPQLWTSTKYDVDNPSIEVKPWYVEFLGGWGSSSTQGQHDDHLTRAMRRFGAETVVDQLSANPTVLNFNTVDSSVKTVTLTKTSTDYNATTAAPFLTSEWIFITKSADSFTVSVREYTASEAALVNYIDREGWITVVAGNAPAVTVTVTQTAPQQPPLNLTGTWNWTGELWETGPARFTPQNGTVTAAYNEGLGNWIFSTLPENQAGSTLNGKPRTDGAIALRVDDDNKVTFVTEDELDIWADFGGLFGNPYRGYYNFATFYDDEFANVVTSLSYMQYGLPADQVIEIAVSNDGNTITFPGTGIYNSAEYYYGFGFGVREITSLTDYTPPQYSSPAQAGGVWRNLVFTRVE